MSYKSFEQSQESHTTPSLQISGKVLGELAQPNFCEKCFWIKFQMRQSIPYAIFPGIFSSIDSFTKKSIHAFMDSHKTPPEFLSELGAISQYIDPPHNSKFRYHDQYTNILLTGEADGIFQLTDGSLLIVDYKTAKYTDNQEEMLPTYFAQLNSYALIAEHLGLGKVSKLALIYMEPMTNCPTGMDRFCLEDSLQMHFYPKILPVEHDSKLVPQLLQQAASILKSTVPLEQNLACKNCKKTHHFISLLSQLEVDNVAIA